MTQAHTQTHNWTGKLGLVLASVGSAIGLGAIWKFPYMVGAEGGATFLIPYVILSFTLAFGLLLAELTVGKVGRGGIVTSYRRLGGKWWGVMGYLAIITGFVLLSYYSVVGGWCLLYFVHSLAGFSSIDPKVLEASFGEMTSSPLIAISCQIGFLALTGLVVAYGIRSIERWTKVLMPMLFFFMLILICTGLSQPGAIEGVKYLFWPDFSKFSFSSLLDAMGLVFFSFSVGVGVMLTYGAYMHQETKLISSTLWIIVCSLLISMMAGLMILPANFAFGVDPGSGPGLTFITMPVIFAKLPGGYYLAIIFFACLVMAALTSSVSMLELDITWMVQELKIPRQRSVIICLLLMLLLSIPCALSFGVMSDIKVFGKTIFDISDFFVSNLSLPIGGLLSAILAAWFAWDKIHTAWPTKIFYPAWKKWVRILIGIFCPALVLAIMISGLL